MIANQRELRRLITEMEDISRQAARLILSETPEPTKHREISPPNPGTAPRQQPVTQVSEFCRWPTQRLPTELPVSYRQNCGGDLIFCMAPGSDTGAGCCVTRPGSAGGSAAGLLACLGRG